MPPSRYTDIYCTICRQQTVYNVLGNQGTNNGFGQFMQKFNDFCNSFSGDPRETVQQLLNSGRMSQEQYNRLSQAATQIQKMMSK